MKKPIIGIVCKPVEKHEMDFWNRMDICDEFRYLVLQNGGLPISLLSPEITFKFNDNDISDPKILSMEELNDIDTIVKLCDGVILQGGLASCNYEIEIAKKCIEYDIPLLGICAGFNNILRALGTDVIEDKTNSHNFYQMDYRHKITNVKDCAKITSYSEDGLVESFEVENKKFILGVKWHPELMLDDEATAIFKNFVDACK